MHAARLFRRGILLALALVAMIAVFAPTVWAGGETARGEVEMVYFYPQSRCYSCERVDAAAREVARAHSPEIPYLRLSIEDPANSERVSRYGVVGSSLFLVDRATGESKELKRVWFLWEDEAACRGYIAQELDAFTSGGTLAGDGNPWAGIPLLAAFALGLLACISPCAIGTNVAALAFLSRQMDDRRRTFFSGAKYTAGRAATYVVLGLGLVYLGVNVVRVSSFLRGTRYVMGPFFIVAGLVMLDLVPLNPFRGRFTSWMERRIPRDRAWSSFALGSVFALAFCPYDAILFFGILIPLAIQTTAGGLTLPAAYALGTGLPLLAFAWLLSFGVERATRQASRAQAVEKWTRRIAALVFLGVGVYYVVTWLA
ncbi:MAG: aromatic aminobenezylarsenical efflux permease ArsG family transporter [Candidatus Geothermincolia bacterium]